MGRLRILLAAFLPGLLAGTQIAGLIFFLNPHLSFDLLTVLSAAGLYGLLLGGLSCVFMLPFLGRRRRRIGRWLPASLTIVLALAGLAAWVHASHYAFYLPPGINRRLVKAAVGLSLAALVCFYTALIHRLRNRPYGRRSQILFGLMSLASIYVVVERREAFRPNPERIPRATTFRGSLRPRLCVVGLETATLDAILPLEEQGRLPFFGKILREGTHARLKTLIPSRPPALWSTLATGKYPYQHGVFGDHSFAPPFFARGASLDLLPIWVAFESWGTRGVDHQVDSTRLKSRPLWDILTRLGVPTAVVGWPVTAPPSADVQVMLSDRFFEEDGDPRFVSPSELAERGRLFRPDLDDIDVAGFGPSPPKPVREALVGDLWRQDLSFFLLAQQPGVEALFLTLPGLSDISRRYFGGYSAVQFEGIQDPESEEAEQRLSAYYTFLDEVLAQLWDRLSEPRILILVSSHGVEGPKGWRHLQHQLLRRPSVRGYLESGSDAVLMFLGDGIRQQNILRPAQLVDLVPTALYGLGFPIARDFEGAVLTDAFETGFLARSPLTFVPSYETLAAP